MIANGADEFRSQLGKARGSIARARSADPSVDPGAAPDDGSGDPALAVVR